MKLNFVIEKNKNFVYFLKSISKFENDFYSKKSRRYLENKFGALSDIDINLIDEFDEFLSISSKKIEKINNLVNLNYSSKVLWNLYADNVFNFKDEYFEDLINRLENNFSERFNLLWDEEFKKIKEWEGLLKKYDFNKFDLILDKFSNFFNVEKINNKIINVNLMIGFNENATYSFSNKSVDNFVNIGLSNTDKTKFIFVIAVILHEIVHCNFEAKSINYLEELKMANCVFIKHKIEKINLNFYYQLNESIINTMASSLIIYSYIGSSILNKEYLQKNNDFSFF